jgi:Predicted nucleotide kinase
VQAILSAQKLGLEGDVKIPGHKDCVLTVRGKMTPAQLSRLRRQFLVYIKMHPTTDTSQIAPLFVHYLNTTPS